MTETPKTLIEAVEYFADPAVCFRAMIDVKWPDGKIVCPKCGGAEIGATGPEKGGAGGFLHSPCDHFPHCLMIPRAAATGNPVCQKRGYLSQRKAVSVPASGAIDHRLLETDRHEAGAVG